METPSLVEHRLVRQKSVILVWTGAHRGLLSLDVDESESPQHESSESLPQEVVATGSDGSRGEPGDEGDAGIVDVPDDEDAADESRIVGVAGSGEIIAGTGVATVLGVAAVSGVATILGVAVDLHGARTA